MNHPSDVDLSLGDPGWMRAGAGVRGQGSGVRECDGIRRTWWFLLDPLPSSWGNASFYGIYGINNLP
jgi:hypothetical protein